MEVWQLLARESIRDIVSRYNANGDSGRFAQVLALFAPDAIMELPEATYTGRDEIATIFTSTQSRVREGDAAGGYVRHFTATHQIDLIDESNATGRLYYAVVNPVGLDHWGRYVDRYRVVEGEWRFASRKVTVDGYSPDSTFQ